MSGAGPSGTEGYAGEAESLVRQYESLSFADVHRHIMHLLPEPPARVLDIGAGTGRDAAGFAGLGYFVTAVEPTAELRLRAQQLHPSPNIAWLDDSLPELRLLPARGEHVRGGDALRPSGCISMPGSGSVRCRRLPPSSVPAD